MRNELVGPSPNEISLREQSYSKSCPRLRRQAHCRYTSSSRKTPSRISGSVSQPIEMRAPKAILQAERKLQQGNADGSCTLLLEHSHGGRQAQGLPYRRTPSGHATGRYPAAEHLSKHLAGAWAAFARRGTPNAPGYPSAQVHLTKNAETMIFDAPTSSAQSDPAGEAAKSYTESKQLRESEERLMPCGCFRDAVFKFLAGYRTQPALLRWLLISY